MARTRKDYKPGSPGYNRQGEITLSKLKKTLRAMQNKHERAYSRKFYKQRNMLGKVS